MGGHEALPHVTVPFLVLGEGGEGLRAGRRVELFESRSWGRVPRLSEDFCEVWIDR